MSDAKSDLPAPLAEILLTLLEKDVRHLAQFFNNPQQNIPIEAIRTHIGRMFEFADRLVAIADEHRAKEREDGSNADAVN